MLRPPARTIRSRLLLILLMATLLLAGIAGALWQLAVKPALSAGIERTQREIAGRSADRIEAFIEQRISELVAAADFGLFWEEQRERQRGVLRQLVKHSPAVMEVAVTDRHGREVLRFSRSRVYTDADLGSLAGQEKFEAPMLGEQFIGDVYHAPSAEPHVTIAVPIRFTPRETGGVLVAEINLKTLWDPISHIQVGRAGWVYVMDRRGRLLAHRDYSQVLLGTIVTHQPQAEPAAASPTARVVGPDGRSLLSTWARVRETGWVVVVEEPLETALAGLHRVERLAAGLILAALLSGVAFAIWFSGRIARPMRQLEDGAAVIAGGRLDHRLEISTGDEIQRVADQFNEMAERLQASREDLERRVAETTRDLSALYAIVAPLSRASDLRSVLEGVLAELVKFTDADGGLVRLVGADAGLVTLPLGASASPAHSSAEWPPEAAVLFERVLAGGDPLVLAGDRVASPTLFAPLLGPNLRSAAILPLRTTGREFGAMVLVSDREGVFGGGQLELFRAISRHVSLALENARLDADARQTTDFLQSVAKSTDPIFTTDTRGFVTYLSPRATEVFGYTDTEILGRRAAELYRGGPIEARQLMQRLMAGGHVQDYETSILSQHRDWVDVSCSLALLRDARDRVIGTVGVVRDTSAEKQLREQLRQAQKMEAIGRLAGGVAHDFNNLLTVIIGRAAILLASEPKRPRDIELIRTTAERAAALTRQLLAFSRQQRLERTVQDLNATVSGVGAMLRRLIGEDVDLTIALGGHELWVNADRTQIEQMLLNLAVNARDAMPQGGRLVIQTSHGAPDDAGDMAPASMIPLGYTVLSVTDTGVGMDSQTLSHIFEPFFTTKGPGKGTGLGLATVYGIVSQHNGRIAVDSRPGGGTTFRVYLPRVAPPAAPAHQQDTPSSLPHGAGTVLLVEDEEPVRELVCETLRMAGYRVLDAAEPGAAILAADRDHEPIDLLLTDVVMPNMNGPQLAEKIRTRRPHIPVLYMSGYTGDALDRHGISAQAAALVYKPFTPGVLLQRVRSALDTSIAAVAASV